MFGHKKDPEPIGPVPELLRTGVIEPALGEDVAPLVQFALGGPARLQRLAEGWQALADRLPGERLDAADRRVLGRRPAPMETPWVWRTAEGLSYFPALETDVGVSGRGLLGLTVSDIHLHAVHEEAGLAMDGAMDLRALTGALAYVQVAVVLDHLRD